MKRADANIEVTSEASLGADGPVVDVRLIRGLDGEGGDRIGTRNGVGWFHEGWAGLSADASGKASINKNDEKQEAKVVRGVDLVR